LSVVIPMYNESMVIRDTLKAVLESDYPHLDIVVINDGSTDGCSAIVQQICEVHPNIRLIEQRPNQGKSAALNRGFAECEHELVITVDADTRLAPQTMQRMAAALASSDLSAVACNLSIHNRENWLTRWQSLEYVAALSLDRRAQHQWGTITTVPGAASGWKRAHVLQAGGFSSETLTEDADLSIQLLRMGRRIHYLPEARAATLAPATLSSLFHQRRRWIFGNLQCIWKHRDAWFTGGPILLKVLGLPNFWFSHLMSFGLFALTIAYLPRATHWLEPGPLAGLLVSIVLADMCICALAIWIDRADVTLLFEAPLQRLGLPSFLFISFLTVFWSKLIRRPIRWRPIRRPKFGPIDS